MRRRAVWRKRFRRIIEVIMRNRLPWRWQLAALPFLLAAIWFSNSRETPPLAPQPAPEVRNSDANTALYQVIAQKRGGATVCGTGQVSKVLKDDTEGSRHQRFILDIGAGKTVLVAHNIDLAPRLPDLQVADSVAFCGQYETNARGGVIHWTHRDPGGRHADGWLELRGKRYQ